MTWKVTPGHHGYYIERLTQGNRLGPFIELSAAEELCDTMNRKEQIADAAPELLAACKQLTNLVEAFAREGGFSPPNHLPADVIDAWKLSRNAITKAEGEETYDGCLRNVAYHEVKNENQR